MKSFFFFIFLAFFLQTSCQKEIKTFRPQKKNVIEAVYGLGKIKSSQKFELFAGILSVVQDQFVQEGDHVQKNDQLLKLTDSPVLKSPLNGVVSFMKISKGEKTIPSTLLLRIENLQMRFLELIVEQESAIKIKPGQMAILGFEGLQNKKFKGRVESLYPRDDEFIVRISLEEVPDYFLPGMTLDVSIEVQHFGKRWIIPKKACSKSHIVIWQKDKWVRRKIKILRELDHDLEVADGTMTEDDLIRYP
jgi:multidrug efflux pump subunit AcrA (membrane-fusion protein)